MKEIDYRTFINALNWELHNQIFKSTITKLSIVKKKSTNELAAYGGKCLEKEYQSVIEKS